MRNAALVMLAACSRPPFVDDAAPAHVRPQPTGSHYHYIVNHIQLPTTAAAARASGVDLDGDGIVDNNVGIGFAALANAGFDIQGTMDRAIADGSIILLIDLQTEDFTTATAAGMTLFAGARPSPSPCSGPTDTVCGHHLDGTGSFVVTPWATRYYSSATIIGAITDGVYSGVDTHAAWTHVELALIGAVPLTLTLRDTHILASSLTSDALGPITVAGAIGYLSDWDDFSTNSVVGALVPELNTIVATDCTTLSSPPACGCVAGSPAAQILTYFDLQPVDCHIADQEVDATTFFAGDDLVLGGPWDGGVSFGIQLTAVPAVFDPPN